MNTPVVNVNVQNFTQQATVPSTGIVCLAGVTRRGPVGDPSILVTSYNQFVSLFGETVSDDKIDSTLLSRNPTLNKFNLYAKKLFTYGAKLRINRLVKGTALQASVEVTATLTNVTTTAQSIFKVTSKYPGADYNGIGVKITEASNGNSGYFNLIITGPTELSEVFTNVPQPKVNATKNDQTYLNKLNKTSQFYKFEYLDIDWSGEGETPTIAVNKKTFNLAGGSDGDEGGVDSAAFAKAMDGFAAISDSKMVGVPGLVEAETQATIASAVVSRGDMVYYGSIECGINESLSTASAVQAKKTGIPNSEYVVLSCGGSKYYDAATENVIELSEIADTMGLTVYTHNNRGVWFDPASKQSAQVLDCLGVVNNFGTPAKYTELNVLANNGINALVYRDGAIEWANSYTNAQGDSSLSFVSSVFLLMYVKDTLVPVYRSYLKEPCDIVTFKAMWRQIQPFLDNLASTQARALWKYEYLGDQDASSLDSLTINSKVEVQQGKYKVYLKLWLIVPMIEVTLNIMLVQGDGEVGIEIG